MRRLLISLAALLPLAGAAAVQADSFGGDGPGSGAQANTAVVVGTIVSVTPSGTTGGGGTIVADAFVVPAQPGDDDNQGDDDGGFGFTGGFGSTGNTGTTGTTGDGGFGFGGGAGHGGGDGGSQGGGGQGGGGQGGGGQGGGSGFGGDWGHFDGSTGVTGATGATGSGGPTEPTPTRVTITVGPNTQISVEGNDNATIADLAAGERFRALFAGSPSDSIQTLTASPALAIEAMGEHHHGQLYAFAGSVTGKTAGTVTVKVSDSFPSGLIAPGSSATFTVGASTLVIGGSGGFTQGSLANVGIGDVVAGGLLGPAGETAAQVESQPLMLLLDVPVKGGTGTTGTTGTTGASGVTGAALKHLRADTLKRAEALLGIQVKAKKTHKAHKTHAKHSKH
ncbi:MAG: hypothetical protein ACYDHH_09045 [Solirubrobacteraceae bacterium]